MHTKFVEHCYRRQTNLAFSISRLITSTSVRIPRSSSHEGSTRDSLKGKPWRVQKSLLIGFVGPRPLKFQVHPQPHRVPPGSAFVFDKTWSDIHTLTHGNIPWESIHLFGSWGFRISRTIAMSWEAIKEST